MKEVSMSTMIVTLAGMTHPMQNLLEDFGCEFEYISSNNQLLISLLATDAAMDLDETSPDIESFFPPNHSDGEAGPHFWTISDNDFELEPAPLQVNFPPEMDQLIYDEYSEATARAEAEQPTITPEEQEYLSLLESLEHSEPTIHHLYPAQNSNHPCDR
jgi:hypothetical protein